MTQGAQGAEDGDKLRAANAELAREIAALKLELAALRDGLAKAEQDSSKASSELVSAQSALAALEARLKQESEQLRSSHASVEEEKTRLALELAAVQSEVTKVRQELHTTVTTHTTVVEKHQQEIAHVTAESARQISQVDRSSVADRVIEVDEKQGSPAKRWDERQEIYEPNNKQAGEGADAKVILALQEELLASRSEADRLRAALLIASSKPQRADAGNPPTAGSTSTASRSVAIVKSSAASHGERDEGGNSDPRMMSDRCLGDPLLVRGNSPATAPPLDGTTNDSKQCDARATVLLYLVILATTFFQLAAIPALAGSMGPYGIGNDFHTSGSSYTVPMMAALPLSEAATGIVAFLLFGLSDRLLLDRRSLVVSSLAMMLSSFLMVIGSRNSNYPLLVAGSVVAGFAATVTTLSASALIYTITRGCSMWNIVAVAETLAIGGAAAFTSLPIIAAANNSGQQAFLTALALGCFGLAASLAAFALNPRLPLVQNDRSTFSSWFELLRSPSGEWLSSVSVGLCVALMAMGATNSAAFANVNSTSGVVLLPVSVSSMLAAFAALLPLSLFVTHHVRPATSEWALAGVSGLALGLVVLSVAGSLNTSGGGYSWAPLAALGALGSMATAVFISSVSPQDPRRDYYPSASLAALALVLSLGCAALAAYLPVASTSEFNGSGSRTACAVGVAFAASVNLAKAFGLCRRSSELDPLRTEIQ